MLDTARDILVGKVPDPKSRNMSNGRAGFRRVVGILPA